MISHSKLSEEALGYRGHIFNLKKHPTNLKDVLSDYNKDYEMLYHQAMKTAHLENIYVYFVSPCLLQESNMKSWASSVSGRIIKRFGCAPCQVNYVVLTYEELIARLLPYCPLTTARDFILNYGTNI